MGYQHYQREDKKSDRLSRSGTFAGDSKATDRNIGYVTYKNKVNVSGHITTIE